MPIDRLGIPSLVMTDGPHGVRTEPLSDRLHGTTTAFPTGVSMAASWNPELIYQVGRALAEETLAMGCDILLGPCVNIVRHPLAGRNFESYSEDPFLAGNIGAAWVNGVQSMHVGASLKHYACNNQEIERGRGDSIVDERTLREIYLAQFEMIVKNANPWTVMCSYNRINGAYASQNHHLLNEILKNEWGYEGVVVSDWGANHTIFESLQGGLDIEMPGPAKYFGRLLEEAVYNWQIDEAIIDNAVRRILRMIYKSGKLGRNERIYSGSVNTSEHQSLARQLAEEAITLLKNDAQILPISASKIRRIAVIGPSACDYQVSGEGSSYVEPPYRKQPLEALQASLAGKVEVNYEKGCDFSFEIEPATEHVLRTTEGLEKGLTGRYYTGTEFAGEALLSRIDSRVDFWYLSFAPLEKTPEVFSIRWTGKLVPQSTGRHTLAIENTGFCRLWLDGNLLLENEPIFQPDFTSFLRKEVLLNLVEGKPYDLKIEYIRKAGLDFPHLRFLFGYTPLPEEDDRFTRAVTLAQTSDIAIVFAGYPKGYESEGRDRPDLNLTGRQNELIFAIANVNPNTIVVLNVGSPISMPWIDQVKAILLAYYPGLEGGAAITRILLGEVNPSGKLPVTFPKRLEDTPAYLNYPGKKEVRYGEGIFVGYRYYDTRNIEPLFPFGYGLSYTTFELKDLVLPARARIGEPIQISVKITNTGTLPGKEVVQLYVRDVKSKLSRPLKELKGFQKIDLEIGETKALSFTLDKRSLSYYDPYQKEWVTEAGEFEVLLGTASRGHLLTGMIEVE